MKNIHQIREVSTLSFNERVLQEAEDTRNPLLERLRFLGIFSSNMDEFFKVRVASVHRRIELGESGMSHVLEALVDQARALDDRFQNAYQKIISGLARHGIQMLTEQDLDGRPADLRPWLSEYFRENILPSLVPIIIAQDRPFPQLTDGALYFGIIMWGSDGNRYAILEIPSELPRFVELPEGSIMYVDDVIRHSLNDVFYIFDYDCIEAYEFKISRDAQLTIDNDFSEGYVRKMERVLQQRKGGRPIRLVFDEQMPSELLKLLAKRLGTASDDTLIGGGRYHNMKDLMHFPERRPDLSFERLDPAPHPVLDGVGRPILDVVRERDILITYPYQSFDHVIRLLREAAIDPEVEEIRMTLYRAARNSQVVNALCNAAQNGKRIFVSIELQARFDERQNIQIAERLSEAGATVVYGAPPMKVHGKLLLIRRKNKFFAGLSTGNFNETTARLYVDSMLLTADKRITREVEQVFGILERALRVRTLAPPKFEHLLVSPLALRRSLLRLLNREKRKGSEGYVCLKINHLTDPKIIKGIRNAADAGVRMDLIGRTTYAMRSHKNINAISILDRLLEHQRIYIFGRGDDCRVFMSSADLMERNLDWRIEVAFPIYAPPLIDEIVETMAIQVRDNVKARVLDDVQSNRYVANGHAPVRAQHESFHYYREAAARFEQCPVADETEGGKGTCQAI